MQSKTVYAYAETVPQVVKALRELADRIERCEDHHRRPQLHAYQRRTSYPPPPDFDHTNNRWVAPPLEVSSVYVLTLDPSATTAWAIELLQTQFILQPSSPPGPEDFKLEQQ